MRHLLKRMAGVRAVFAVAVAIMVVFLRSLFPLPDVSDRETSHSLPFSTDTALGVAMASAGSAHDPALSGVRVLETGRDALAARLALIDAAQASVDAQYYIWHDDVSGILLLDALDRAARRGVRVRLLLDDNGIPGLDPILAALDAHENIQVRLFNPSTIRNPKGLGFAIDFLRMNRRMHNKAMIVDGAAAIIGGRNIGDAYFQVDDDMFYVDTDAIATGAVVGGTATIFDDYWNSRPVIELDRLVDPPDDRSAFEDRVSDMQAHHATADIRASAQTYAQDVTEGRLAFQWVEVSVMADDPLKALGEAQDRLLIHKLYDILDGAKTRIDLASAYFVPGKDGTEYFSNRAEDGTTVRILTNALDTTDVFLVHAGYSRYRRALLEGGIDLYELKLRGLSRDNPDGQVIPLGLAGGSLHAKTFAIDEARIFIGSFNFDPRSARLNCEMGFLIESPDMARQMTGSFDELLPDLTYQPRLTPRDRMVWVEAHSDRREVIHQQEPGANWLQQAAFAVIRILPVEWLL